MANPITIGLSLNGVDVGQLEYLKKDRTVAMSKIYKYLLSPIHASKSYDNENFPTKLPRVRPSIEFTPKYPVLEELDFSLRFRVAKNLPEQEVRRNVYLGRHDEKSVSVMSIRQFLLLIELLHSRYTRLEICLLIQKLTMSFLYEPFYVSSVSQPEREGDHTYRRKEEKRVSKLLTEIGAASHLLDRNEKEIFITSKEMAFLSSNVTRIYYSGSLSAYLVYLDLLDDANLLTHVINTFNNVVHGWLRNGTLKAVTLRVQSWRVYMEKKLFHEPIFSHISEPPREKWKRQFHLTIPDGSPRWVKSVTKFVHTEKALQKKISIDDSVLRMLPSYTQITDEEYLTIVAVDDKDVIMGYVTATLYKIDFKNFLSVVDEEPAYDEDKEVNAWLEFYTLFMRASVEGKNINRSLYNYCHIDGIYLAVKQRGNNLASLLVYYLIYFLRKVRKELGLFAIGSYAAALPTLKILQSYGGGFYDLPNTLGWITDFSDRFFAATLDSNEETLYFNETFSLLRMSLSEYNSYQKEFLSLLDLLKSIKSMRNIGERKDSIDAFMRQLVNIQVMHTNRMEKGIWTAKEKIKTFLSLEINSEINTIIPFESNSLLVKKSKELEERIKQEALLSSGKRTSEEELGKEGDLKRTRTSLVFPLSFLNDSSLL